MDPMPKFLCEETYNETDKIDYPNMYEVFLLNDDKTPMDFVIFVIQSFFHKSFDEATDLMLKVHKDGRVLCEICTKEIAETKIMQVMDFANKNHYPLKCVMQKRKSNVI